MFLSENGEDKPDDLTCDLKLENKELEAQIRILQDTIIKLKAGHGD